jgi:hypothetical protein
VCATSNGSEWSAYQWSRCDSQTLRALSRFVVEVTISGAAECAGISFGRDKDCLTELDSQFEQHRLKLEVDTLANTWAFWVDGCLAGRRSWDSAIRNTADIIRGDRTLKACRLDYVLFQDLAVYALPRRAGAIE